MSTFTSAANVCDTEVDQPYFNGSAQSLTWSGNAGDDFITIGGTVLLLLGGKISWRTNRYYDTNGDLIIDGKEITEIRQR